MPMGHTTDGSFHAGTGIARKRGLPYARNHVDGPSPHTAQPPAGGNASGVSFYISGPRPARLFPTPVHEFRKGKYATTGGDRGFMTVFEYDVRGHTMMIDVDTSFVRFTSITQALGKNKVNFGRLVRTCPALDPHITKLKGGYLSIQGTWLPYDLAKELSRRIAWEIRDHLVPLFGYDFPSICLRPDSEGFGQLAIGMSQKRARKRHNNGGPHQTSCYGPSLPISVVDGQTVEHKLIGKGGVQNPYQQSQPATTFHYSKGFGLERPHWYGHDGLATNGMTAGLDNMMWPAAAPIGAGGGGGGGGGLQVPGLGSAGSTPHASCTSPLVGLEGSGGSPILSSPPSSNTSTSSAQNYAANYGLMVPPTVPSHSMSNEAASNEAGGGSSSLFELHHASLSSVKPEPIAETRGCGGFSNHAYSSYTDQSTQLSTWSDSSHASASAYVSSSPTSPPPAPHAPPTFQFDSWQQSTGSSS
ncbi:uncharacterized protein UTRI_05757 [Ustilago trichophora]|uniref:HTH APSES-type domain-containing protein n=1 Tax=Ustilago trichophora TaxID=86804 RepID=A0A5C3EI79_9BASI|nr:uncharacterized protein UTRI_05757 [Ustilago trichophora]